MPTSHHPDWAHSRCRAEDLGQFLNMVDALDEASFSIRQVRVSTCPELYRTDDADLVAAREAGFDVMRRAVEAGLGTAAPADAQGIAIAAWSAAHGFAVLWLNGNLPPELTEDPEAIASVVVRGFMELGDITRRQAAVTHILPAD